MDIIANDTKVQQRTSDSFVYYPPRRSHRLLRPLWCGIAEQVLYEDGEWDVFKIPNSSVQVFNRLPCGTQSNHSLLDIVLPDGTLPSGKPSRKRA
jgi:hypothetical protein